MNIESPDQVSENTTPEYSEIELKALEMGWKPKEEFSGDETDFIDAKEFVNRKPLFDRIEHQSRQLKAVQRALDALKGHYTKVQETEFNRALSVLKAERKEALKDGDADKFDTLDDQIKQVEGQLELVKEAAATPSANPEEHPEFVSWVSKNSWYNTTGYMRAFADDVGSRLARQGMSPSDVLREVEKAVRKEFPQKFTNPNKQSAPDVSSSRAPATTSSKADNFPLTDEERKIMNTLIASDPKTFTKEKYIADLKKIKGLE